jgi:hypothetical protein
MLTEEHRIKRSSQKELFKIIDEYCYRAKNLLNTVQYLICQSYRIHQKLKNSDTLEQWEDEMISRINDAVCDLQPDLHSGKVRGVEVIL